MYISITPCILKLNICLIVWIEWKLYFVFSYDDTGTRLKDGIACYKLKPKTVLSDGKPEKYYPLGDVCVNKLSNDIGKDNGNLMSFGDYNNPSKKNNKTVGPNLDSVLVNGKIIASGTSSQIKLNSDVKEAYLGTD